jgi:uncharacterized protein (UPF0548 family)
MVAEKDLAERQLSYAPVGATRLDQERWAEQLPGFRRYARTVRIGRGQQLWEVASAALLEWGVKSRSGFVVVPGHGAGARVREGAEYWLLVSLGRWVVREPVRVVAVIDQPDRRGFAYGTLDGHPVAGEEAFVLHRTSDENVWLTLRSLTQPAPGRWRLAFPVLLVAQLWYRWRYRRALRSFR